MPLKLQIFIISLALLILIYIYISIKKKRVLLKYALLWLGACFFVIISAIIPDYMLKIASLLGIKTLSNMMFLLAMIFLFTFSFSLTIIVSKQKQKIITLTQELAILKNKVEKDFY